MSEQIKHECGIVQIRLLKPASYYAEKYGTTSYALGKLYLMMEKQHNRGQEGAGIAVVKIDSPVGGEYIYRERAQGSGAITEIFAKVNRARSEKVSGEPIPFDGEVYMGHLRYSTTGRSGLSYVHPFLRRNNWKCRNLCLAGNFNLTNVPEVMASIVAEGQHPRHNADTFIILEQLGDLLDRQCEELYKRFGAEGLTGAELNDKVEVLVDVESILREASATWDGGYVITGATGSGDSFVIRDPWGIRSAHYYIDDEIVVVASERAVIQTAMNVTTEQTRLLAPGEALIIRKNGEVITRQINEPINPRPCSFERIYFSRGSDADIYRERKMLGRLLVGDILREVDYDIDHTVFSFIPNTAEVAWYGMMEGLERYVNERKVARLTALGADATPAEIAEIVGHKVRTEKLAIKDIKLRTFIEEGDRRNELATHVYDITYDTITPEVDNIVVIDDSIVRGTTLRQSIVKILSRLRPRKIVIVSSSPQVRYPDCYGIDMSRMEEFIAFHAAVSLIVDADRQSLLDEVYAKCRASLAGEADPLVNHVKEIYAASSYDEVSRRIAELVTPEGCECPVAVVYQTVEKLSEACPTNNGDWYFSGNYPTAGGVRVANRSYVNWYEKYWKPATSL
ncbi:MAG: amidophosphoribosyltransferase [Rikenellaceae bacterium]|jgi:amidophosphoribosyltransferase|nr:amidophosphoribosyltransferase [Rikenellaceae bacterium]